MLRNTEIKLLKEKDTWIYKLRDKRAKLTIRLIECIGRVQEFKQHEKLSEAEEINEELRKISAEIEEFNKDVVFLFLKQKFLFKKRVINYF